MCLGVFIQLIYAFTSASLVSSSPDAHEAPRFSGDQHHAGLALTHPQRFDAHFMEIGPGGETGKIRKKRSTHNNHNNEYTMEILVAVDKKMQEYHGDETRNYVLTLMSIVSQRPPLPHRPIRRHWMDGGPSKSRDKNNAHPSQLSLFARYPIYLPMPVLGTQSVLQWST